MSEWLPNSGALFLESVGSIYILEAVSIIWITSAPSGRVMMDQSGVRERLRRNNYCFSRKIVTPCVIRQELQTPTAITTVIERPINADCRPRYRRTTTEEEKDNTNPTIRTNQRPQQQ
ncbi:hypothetical protein Btru_073689 [Bulinus truncatus]|nr:hypothetical protein Btru_073689 [Bulinus truncatus]